MMLTECIDRKLQPLQCVSKMECSLQEYVLAFVADEAMDPECRSRFRKDSVCFRTWIRSKIIRKNLMWSYFLLSQAAVICLVFTKS